MPKKEKPPINCFVCGDNGLVPRYYVEPYIGSIAGKHLIPCPKCRPIEFSKMKETKK